MICMLLLTACGNYSADSELNEHATKSEITFAIQSDPEPNENGSDTLSPVAFYINDHVHSPLARYDLNEDERVALLEMLNGLELEKIDESTLDTSWYQDKGWDDYLYCISFSFEGDISNWEFYLYDDNIASVSNEFYTCSGFDTELIERLAHAIAPVEKSRKDIDSACDSFAKYFSGWEEKGCTLTELQYDDELASFYTRAFSHDSKYEKSADENDVIVLSFNYTTTGDEFPATQPSNAAIAILMKGEDEHWHFILSQNI